MLLVTDTAQLHRLIGCNASLTLNHKILVYKSISLKRHGCTGSRSTQQQVSFVRRNHTWALTKISTINHRGAVVHQEREYSPRLRVTTIRQRIEPCATLYNTSVTVHHPRSRRTYDTAKRVETETPSSSWDIGKGKVVC